jgi:hypothetical protein
MIKPYDRYSAIVALTKENGMLKKIYNILKNLH